MNIFSLIFRNWARGPQAHRYPDHPVAPAGFRGAIVVDPGLCLTCGVCEEVCVSAAIEVLPGEASGTWSYDPGRCTFCGACVRHCPVTALHHTPTRAPAYTRPGETSLTSQIVYPACDVCGGPTLPYTHALLQKAFPDGDWLTARSQLCPQCRQRAAVAAMKESLGNQSAK